MTTAVLRSIVAANLLNIIGMVLMQRADLAIVIQANLFSMIITILT